MKLDRVESLLCERYPQYKLLNLYLFGSRLYGCASEDSDFDFIAVIEGPFFFNSQLIETEKININIYHIEFFRELVHQHILAVSSYYPNIQRRRSFAHSFLLNSFGKKKSQFDSLCK